ncbi:RNA-directed DNA polymerase from mobile element jockey-like [Brachionus plicatilis]|uniref:RNA-directed DNA polymerase from mobile element jockey-like n=1 Tax=Brachionus plicatilis TaxID=10195 RepID=A0A3M7QXG9_BRAPC|nr:RNA-directed DNA polymerase from mobile element jockey-like [Brachionus plicatilis]
MRIVKTKGDQEWMNVEIKQLIRERQRLHSAGEHNLRDQLALRIVGLIATRKATFYREKYTRSKAGMWEHANKLRKPPTLLPPDPEYGELLNEQFSDTVWQGVTRANISRFIRRYALPPVVPVFNFTNVGEQLRNVKSTSAGPDGISGKLLYSARLELVSPLVTIFNHCVNKGIVTDEWRLGNITPIPKVQNPAKPSDMRPIAIISTPCKIMERIITKQILRLVRNTFGNIPQEIVDAVQRWCVDNKMRLNVGKCKMIFINSPRVLGSSVPSVYLLGQMLETVKSYKYLGFELSDSLDLDLQWRRVRSIVSPVEFLLKQLKLNGWSTPMLICVYRAYCLSHFTYSAVMLTSASAAAKCEMNAFNSRLWRIMGIDDQTAGSYKLLPIAEFIDQVCEQTLNRILADPNHPITSCQPRNLRLNARFPFQTRLLITTASYRSSFENFATIPTAKTRELVSIFFNHITSL